MSMHKPNNAMVKSPTSSNSQMPTFIPDPSLNGQSFDQLINNRGIRFVHRISVPCPNIQSRDDNSHDPHCPVCEGDGMFFYQEKEITGLFYSNSLEKTFETMGVWEFGTAVVTLPTQYPDGSQADFNMLDQLVIPDFTVRLWELQEYSPDASGIEYLRYPIQKIDYLAFANNGVIQPKIEGVDFIIQDGGIKFLPGSIPRYDNVNERGDCYTISYFANPVYTVVQNLRELRVSQEMISGQKTTIRLPQQVLVKRDFLANANDTKRN
jgi:hypothetical protein